MTRWPRAEVTGFTGRSNALLGTHNLLTLSLPITGDAKARKTRCHHAQCMPCAEHRVLDPHIEWCCGNKAHARNAERPWRHQPAIATGFITDEAIRQKAHERTDRQGETPNDHLARRSGLFEGTEDNEPAKKQ